MQFNKSYNRQEFVNFLRDSFLPDDFQPIETPLLSCTRRLNTPGQSPSSAPVHPWIS